MDLSVCVCTHDRLDYVHQCLDGLARQTVGPAGFGIILVDSASTGDTPYRLAKLAASLPNCRLVRLERSGVSQARNAGAAACETPYLAYIDDDAIPASDWVERILAALATPGPAPVVLGGRILPRWETPLPRWWPASLRGVLSIIETEGQGEYRHPPLPPGLAPYGANLVVHVASLREIGGFPDAIGRCGRTLLSDEDVQVAWRLQEAGGTARYDSRIVVHHQIQPARLTPRWLLSRLYWQGVSTVITRRLLRHSEAVWTELPRRLAVALLCAPAGLVPATSCRLLPARWRLAYAAGFVCAALAPRVAVPRASGAAR